MHFLNGLVFDIGCIYQTAADPTIFPMVALSTVPQINSQSFEDAQLTNPRHQLSYQIEAL